MAFAARWQVVTRQHKRGGSWVFELVMWWRHERKSVDYANRALSIQAVNGAKNRRTIRSRNLLHR
jgi:hypothetical protein